MFRSVMLVTALVAAGFPAQAWADDKPSQSEKKKEDEEPLRIGAVASLGFPRPFALEGMVKLEQQLTLGVEYSFLPRMTVSNVSTRFDAFALDANWHPFKGGFFIGLRGGRQWLSGSATLTVSNVGSFTETADAATWFVNPRFGYLYTFRSGFTLGIDAGVQLPIGATYERSGPATAAGLAQGTTVDNTLKTVANVFGNDVTPTVDLLRVGFLF